MMSVQAVEDQVRDVVQTQDEAPAVPGVALVKRGLVDPAGQNAPVGESLRGGDHRQADVVVWGAEPVGGSLFADLPADAAQRLRGWRRGNREIENGGVHGISHSENSSCCDWGSPWREDMDLVSAAGARRRVALGLP